MPKSKIDDEIADMIKDKLEKSPDNKVQVIVSLDKNASVEDAKRDLAERGLEIENAIQGPIPFVSGSVSIKDISGLAAVPKVKKVERDSEIHAL